jgi:predicted nucleic acid-binding protein
MDVSIDSQILSFWMKRRPPSANNKTQDVAEMFRRSRLLIDDLKRRDARIYVPTVVVSELLIGIEREKHGSFIAALQSLFVVVPFDVRATSLAAELWMHNHSLPPEEKLERRYLKSDVLILASAKVAGARFFYSYDKKCRKLADKAGMIGRDLPENSEFLFDMEDPKKGGADAALEAAKKVMSSSGEAVRPTQSKEPGKIDEEKPKPKTLPPTDA